MGPWDDDVIDFNIKATVSLWEMSLPLVSRAVWTVEGLAPYTKG